MESLGTFRTKSEAEHALVLAEADQIEGVWQPTPTDPGTVKDWAERWLEEAHHLKSKTRAGHEHMLRRHVLPRWGNVPITAVRRDDVTAWVTELVGAGHQPDVVRLAVAALRSTIKTAVTAGLLPANPASGISLLRNHRHEMHPLTVAEVEALAEAISHPELRPGGHGARVGRAERPDLALAVRLAAYTGLRAGELWALRRKHLIWRPGQPGWWSR